MQLKGISSAIVGFLYVSFGVSACGERRSSAVTATDSAGIRITLSQDAARTFAVVDTAPALSLGGANVSGPTQVSRIQGLHVDGSGNVWVADGASNEVRLFRSDGSHWKTIGGRGEGPGEFMRLRLLGAFADDSVAFWDHALARLTIADAHGEFARSTRVPVGDEPPPMASGVFADGTLLAQATRILAARSLRAGQLLSDTAHLIRVDIADMATTMLGTAPGPTWVWTGSNQVPLPFTINANFVVHDKSVVLVAGPEFRITVLRSGYVAEIFGVTRPVRQVDEEALAEYAAFYEENLPEASAREYLSVLDHEARPGVMPAYSRVLGANGGHTWAQVYSADMFAAATWDVFDAERIWLGQVETPMGFIVMTIVRNSLFGVWRDEMGVEYVRVYRFRPVEDGSARVH